MPDCGCFYFRPDSPLPRKYGLGAAALRYAALGFAVIPLARGAKRPHAMLGDVGGIHLASTDEGQIMEWWSMDMAANIGVATGSRNRLAVVDLDVKRGNNGPSEWFRFLNGPPPCVNWPNTPVVRTPSGGEHYWLRTDGPVPERNGILPGVDIKGDGGLVVAPPSMALVQPITRPGERGSGEVPVPYEWVSGCPHAAPDVPLWFTGWLALSPPAPRADHQRTASGAPLDEILDEYGKNGLPVSMRNREMYRVACGLYRRYGTHAAGASKVMECVRWIYDRTDTSDNGGGAFTWREVMVCVESARRFIERAAERENRMNAEFVGWLEKRHWNG